MNSGTGIQELMAAETRASQIVAEARIGMFLPPRLRRGSKLCSHLVFAALAQRFCCVFFHCYTH